MNLDEYLLRDATELAASVRRGDVTGSELLTLAQACADAANPALNAIVMRLDDVARERAEDRTLPGPFAGVPFLIKDLSQEYRGFPTSYGSRALAHNVADRHALVVERFLDAGLVIFGKTNTPELGAKGVTEPEHWGAAHNPWNTGHTPGGSSGGSGAAVAAGIVPAAGANDGGGSIRIPAACNGLVGLKVGRGVAPYGPQTGEPKFGMACQGVLSRTVRDSAGLYDAIIAPNARADYAALLPSALVEYIATEPEPVTVGFSAASAINPNPHPDAVAAVERAAELLADLGHRVEPVHPPYDDGALARDFLTIWFANVHGQISGIKARFGATDGDFEADTLAIAELGRSAGVGALMVALDRINDYQQSLASFHERFDFFLTPTLATPPLRVGATTTPRLLQQGARIANRLRGGRLMAMTGLMDDLIEESLGWVPYTQLANLTGRPAISLPLHWTESGLPLGVQFVGRLGAEGDLLRLAAQLERAQPWLSRYSTPMAHSRR